MIDYWRLGLAIAEMLDVGYTHEWIGYLMDTLGVPDEYERPSSSDSKYVFSKNLFEHLSYDDNLRDIIVDFAVYIIQSERFDPRLENAARKHLPVFKKFAEKAGLDIQALIEKANDKPQFPQPDVSEYFASIAQIIKSSQVEDSIKHVAIYDLDQSFSCYQAGAYKACVVMLGAVLEGLMIGVLRSPNTIRFLQKMTNPPAPIARLGVRHPELQDQIASKLGFEDYRISLDSLVVDIDKLGIDHIQKFRNAIHPWKAIQEKGVYGSFDSARAVHHISSLRILAEHMLNWNG